MMRELLIQMFNGWIIHEASWDPESETYKRSDVECFIEACGGDAIRGNLVSVFAHWGNDIQALAPHYGIALDRGEDGKLFINENIPSAPSPEHWWYEGQWKEPGADNDGTEAARVDN